MTDEKKISTLLSILTSEQQTLQRVDQKAFTMLSLLGVFAVFFIVHYTKIPPTIISSILIFIYFVSIITAIIFLVSVVSPRIKETENISAEKKTILPTFFGGIVKYKSAEDYAKELGIILDDKEATYRVFSNSVYSIGRINSYKHKYLKYGIRAFVVAIGVEFTIIIMLYLRLLILESN
jgi:predicted neutral ceramidase superfamily lipid hydrolase